MAALYSSRQHLVHVPSVHSQAVSMGGASAGSPGWVSVKVRVRVRARVRVTYRPREPRQLGALCECRMAQPGYG